MEYVVFVKPGSRRGTQVQPVDNPGGTLPALAVSVAERAIDGAANAALIKALAAHFGVRRSHVRIIAGEASRQKRVSIALD